MSGNEFRKLALMLEGTVEGEHMGHPDFRVAGRIFATLTEDEDRGMVKLPPDAPEDLLADARGIFTPAKGGWGRAGCTVVDLAKARTSVVKGALMRAWEFAIEVNSAKAPRSPEPRRSAPRPSRGHTGRGRANGAKRSG